jgi:hypothetical protein
VRVPNAVLPELSSFMHGPFLITNGHLFLFMIPTFLSCKVSVNNQNILLASRRFSGVNRQEMCLEQSGMSPWV